MARKISRILLAATVAVAWLTVVTDIAPAAATVAGPSADYQLKESLQSSVGTASALRPIGVGPIYYSHQTIDGVGGRRLSFYAGSGVGLSDATPTVGAGTYTIAVLLRLNERTGAYRRIIDFKNGTADSGIYIGPQNQLMSYQPSAGGTASFVTGTWHQVVVTRDGSTNILRAYLDGVLQVTVSDPGASFALDSADQLRFFKDNTVGCGCGENSSGSVARIRLSPGALDDAAVAALDRLPAQTLAVTVPDGDLAAGTAFTVKATLRNLNGNVVTSYDGPGTWSNTTGPISPSVPNAFVNGVSTTKVTITKAMRKGRIMVSASKGVGGSRPFNVIGALHHFGISNPPAQVFTDTPFEIRVTAKDSAGNVVTTYNNEVALSDLSGTISPTSASPFVNGVSATSVTISVAHDGDRITARRGTKSVATRAFAVDT